MPNLFCQRSPCGPGVLFPGIRYAPAPPFSFPQAHALLLKRGKQQSDPKTSFSLSEAAGRCGGRRCLRRPRWERSPPRPRRGRGRAAPAGREAAAPAALPAPRLPAEPRPLPLTLPRAPSAGCGGGFARLLLKVPRCVLPEGAEMRCKRNKVKPAVEAGEESEARRRGVIAFRWQDYARS